MTDVPSIRPFARTTAAVGDSLSVGVVALVALTIAQRLIGFVRGVVLSRVFDPVELGQWDLALGFLTLAAPLVVLGVPGSLGRYYDYFRVRGQLSGLLRLTIRVCLVAMAASAGGLLLFSGPIASVLFGARDRAAIATSLAAALAAVIAGNTAVTTLLAARMYRVASRLQFVHGVAFAVTSVTLALVWRPTVESAIAGYGLASALVVLLAVPALREVGRGGRAATAAGPSILPPVPVWVRLAPFAAALWLANLLTNAFDLTDRFLIVHASGLSAEDALAQVGGYHAARLLPLVMVALAALLGTALTPTLSRDWEEGRRAEATARLDLFLRGLLLGAHASAVLVLLATPLLFGVALGGKFPGGPAFVPLMAAYGVWFGAIPVAQNYLWCLERAWLGNVALVAGLGLNIGLSLILLPRYGVFGVAMATSVSNLASLALVLLFSARLGMRWHRGLWPLVLMPMTLWFGAAVALLSLALVGLVALRTNHLVTGDERRQLASTIRALAWRGQRRG